MKKKRRFAAAIIKTLLATLFAIAFLLPTVLTFANSFMSTTEIQANYGAILENADNTKEGAKTYIANKVNLKFIPDMVTLKQYITVLFMSPEYLLKFWNSIILVGPIVIFQLVVGAGAAYSFTRFRGAKKEILFFTYIVLMLMPYQVTLVPNYLVAKWLGTLDTRWAILLPGFFAPFSVFLLTKFMRRIPNSLIESAEIDGAGEWYIFTRVCLPMSKSSMFSVALLVFIDYWNMVEQPLILLSDEEMYPLSVFLSRINTGEVGLAFAVATIYMIPAMLLFLYGEEYLVEGIAYSAAVKG